MSESKPVAGGPQAFEWRWPDRTVLGVVLAIVLGVTVWAIPFLWTEETLTGVDGVLVLLSVLTLFPLAMAITASGDVLGPEVLLGGVGFALFALRGLFLRFGDVVPTDLPPNLVEDYEPYFADAVTYVAVSWATAMVGLFMPLGRVVRRALPLSTVLSNPLVENRLPFLVAVGIAFKGVQVAAGQQFAFVSGEVDQNTIQFISYLSSVDLAAMGAYVFLFARRRLSNTGITALWAGLVPFELAWGLFTGGKQRLVVPVLIVILGLHYGRRRFGTSVLVGMVLGFAFIVQPLVTEMRTQTVESGAVENFTAQAGASAAASAAQLVSSQDNFVEDALRGFTNRFHGIDSMMIALKHTPMYYPHTDPTLYYLWPLTATIPRAIWPTKPIMNPIPDWERLYWGTTSENASSFARTFPAGLYLAFGWWPGILGMLLVGIGWRIFIEAFRAQWGPAAFLVYAQVLPFLLRVENDVPSTFANLVQALIVYVPIGILLVIRTGRPLRAARLPGPVRP